MASLLRSRLLASSRTFSTSSARPSIAPPPLPKVPIKLIAELRAVHPIGMAKAKEALAKSGLSVQDALVWLQKDLEAGGAIKQAKLSSRTATEGLIAVGVMGEGWGRRGGIVELNCETSFVNRTDGFISLLQSIHHTAVFFHNPTSPASQENVSHLVNAPIESVLDAPLIAPPPEHDTTGNTVAQSITSLLTTTGEKISLRRAAIFAPPTDEEHDGIFYPAFFAHTPTGLPSNLGSPAAFVVLHLTGPGTVKPSKALLADTEMLGRQLARQMVAVPCRHLYAFKGGDGLDAMVEGSDVLMEQHFMFFDGPEGGSNVSVGQVLHAWGKNRDVQIRVEGGERWVVGDSGAAEVDEAQS